METSKQTTQDVIKALMTMAVIMDKQLTKEAASMLIEDLSGYEPEKILTALKLCRLELTRFPSTAEIIKRISTKSDASQTQDLLGRIYSAISLYGWPNPEGARAHVGEVGWKAIMYFGGWKRLCDYPLEDDMALRSQITKSITEAVSEHTRCQMLGLPFQSGDTVNRPLENNGLKSLVFNIDDYR